MSVLGVLSALAWLAQPSVRQLRRPEHDPVAHAEPATEVAAA